MCDSVSVEGVGCDSGCVGGVACDSVCVGGVGRYSVCVLGLLTAADWAVKLKLFKDLMSPNQPRCS